MPKIDVVAVPKRKGVGYPPPFDAFPQIASGSGSATPAASRISA